jgi:hypothetical protein
VDKVLRLREGSNEMGHTSMGSRRGGAILAMDGYGELTADGNEKYVRDSRDT